MLPVTGRTVRFAVGTVDGPASDSWVVSTNVHGDIYLKCRDLDHDCKVSLHASGRWRLAYTQGTAAAADMQANGQDRVVFKWDRPSGWGVEPVPCFRIIVPLQGLYRLPESRVGWRKKMVWVPPHGRADCGTMVSVYAVPDGQRMVDEAGILATLDLVDGMKVHVVAWYLTEFSDTPSMRELGEAVLRQSEDMGLSTALDDIVMFHGEFDGARMMMNVPVSAWAK